MAAESKESEDMSSQSEDMSDSDRLPEILTAIVRQFLDEDCIIVWDTQKLDTFVAMKPIHFLDGGGDLARYFELARSIAYVNFEDKETTEIKNMWHNLRKACLPADEEYNEEADYEFDEADKLKIMARLRNCIGTFVQRERKQQQQVQVQENVGGGGEEPVQPQQHQVPVEEDQDVGMVEQDGNEDVVHVPHPNFGTRAVLAEVQLTRLKTLANPIEDEPTQAVSMNLPFTDFERESPQKEPICVYSPEFAKKKKEEKEEICGGTDEFGKLGKDVSEAAKPKIKAHHPISKLSKGQSLRYVGGSKSLVLNRSFECNDCNSALLGPENGRAGLRNSEPRLFPALAVKKCNMVYTVVLDYDPDEKKVKGRHIESHGKHASFTVYSSSEKQDKSFRVSPSSSLQSLLDVLQHARVLDYNLGAGPVLGGAGPVVGGAGPVLGGPVLGGAVLGGAGLGGAVVGGAGPVVGGAGPVVGDDGNSSSELSEPANKKRIVQKPPIKVHKDVQKKQNDETPMTVSSGNLRNTMLIKPIACSLVSLPAANSTNDSPPPAPTIKKPAAATKKRCAAAVTEIPGADDAKKSRAAATTKKPSADAKKSAVADAKKSGAKKSGAKKSADAAATKKRKQDAVVNAPIMKSHRTRAATGASTNNKKT